MKIVYKKLRDNAVLPYAATEMSGGLDITAAHIEHVSENEVIVYTGFAMQPVNIVDRYKEDEDGYVISIPDVNYRIRFSPRSSFTGTNWVLQNSPCLGDADFTGEYRLRFRGIPVIHRWGGGDFKVDKEIEYDEFPYKVGDRVAQMWVEEIIPIEFVEGELINHTDRKGGFGSTGK